MGIKIYTYMRGVKTIIMIIVSMMSVVVVGCDDMADNGVVSNAYMQTEEVKGESKNCAVVLRAQQGTSFSMTIQSKGDWAHFSSGDVTMEAVMESVDKIVYIYFDKNSLGASRTADIEVRFSDGRVCDLTFTQHSYDASIAFSREWAELPVCRIENGYIFGSHYGTMGYKNDARNYTFCFDPSLRASLWVAYPLHKDHMTGDGDRANSDFGYDPSVDSKCQAHLSRSYNGWYDRGHQLPAADRKCSQQMMDQTFYATNMTPQQGNFNQVKWGAVEGKVRNMACKDTLYVVTGAYFGGEHHSSIDAQTTDRSGNKCPTPTHYYKALLRTKKGNTGKRIDEIDDANQLRAIAIWMEHANTGEDKTITKADCISVEELEKITGFIFFPMIDDKIEQSVKRTMVPSEWSIN